MRGKRRSLDGNRGLRPGFARVTIGLRLVRTRAHNLMTAMQITFLHRAGQPDHVFVQRTDGSQIDWPFPNFGQGLPHDLVHLLVEVRFGLRDGFWGRVDAGVDPARINAASSRTVGKLQDKYAGFGRDLTGLLHAEALANLGWHRETDLEQALAASCDRHGVAPLQGIPGAQLQAMQAELESLRLRWLALLPKGSLRFDLDLRSLTLRMG